VYVVRVAIVTESFLPTWGGVTTTVCHVLDRLAATGHEAMVICPGPAPASYRGFPVRTVRGVKVRGLRVGLPTAEMERHLLEWQPDIVHVASPFGLGARGLGAARNLQLPSIAVFQTDMPSFLAQHTGPMPDRVSHLSWRRLRHVHSLADVTLAPNTTTMKSLAAKGIPRTAVWARGVDTATYHPKRRDCGLARELRQCLAPNGETIVGYVGRLSPEKELDRLAEIADLPGTSLAIVGDGPARDRLERLLPKASFLGHRQGMELAGTYAAFDMFVHPGSHEMFGQTLQEAMATGLPVVAAAAGGPLDLVRAGVTGLLFDPTRPGAFREAVGGLVSDDAMRNRMGRNGRLRIECRSWPAVVDELVGLYSDVLNPAYLRRAA
jgi:phosphatidylinositol alpha 1,6-mannosyltransferase